MKRIFLCLGGGSLKDIKFRARRYFVCVCLGVNDGRINQ